MRITLRRINSSKLNNVSFSIASAEFASAVFENDEVKESFIKTLLGMEKVRSGKILLDERDITTLKIKDRMCALVSSKPYLREDMTIYDNIAYPLRKNGEKEEAVEKVVDNLIEKLGLSHIRHLMPSSISYYQALKVSLARSIAFMPKVLLFDDPLLELDESKSIEYESFIKEVHEFLDRPVIIYIGRILDETKKVLTVSKNGEVLDFQRREIALSHPSNADSARLLSLETHEIDNQAKIQIPCLVDGLRITYQGRILTLNPIYMKRILSKERELTMELDRNSFQSYDKGNSLKFMIDEIDDLGDGVVRLNLEGFHLYKLSRDDYREATFIYYPVDDIVFKDLGGEICSTSIHPHVSYVNVSVINQFMGLVRIGNSILSIGKRISKKVKQVSIRPDIENKISKNRKGLMIKRILDIEEFKDHYLMEAMIKGNQESIIIRLGKETNPLEMERLYIDLDKDAISIPLIEI